MFKNWLNLAIIFTLSIGIALGLSQCLSTNSAAIASASYSWNLPEWTPKPIVPDDNPITIDKVELGRYLFYDKRLSVTGNFSCGSCHLQALAFTDGKKVGVGATGEPHPRNSMSLANIAYNSVLTWNNPLMKDLETQMLVPLFGEEPIELGMAGKEEEILATLEHDSKYSRMFAKAFPEEEKPINLRNLTRAIATFERTLVSFNSPYDRYRYEGDRYAISEAAKRGERLFFSERLECFHCHGGLNFSDSIQHERLAFVEISYHNTGLYNIDGKGAYPPENTGLFEITHNPEDMGHFKAPTLRNIALTAPYMHDGSIATLDEAISHYQAGGRTIVAGQYSGVGRRNPYKSPFINGFQLTERERLDLIAFLQSLTDEEFIKNPALSDPFLRSN